MKKIVPFVFLLLGCSKDKPIEAVQPTPQPSSSIAQINQDIPKETVEINACPAGMNRVKGNYCDNVEQICLKWIDDSSLPYARCLEYKKPSICIGNKIPMDFCMSIYEEHDPVTKIPYGNISWTEAKKYCKDKGGDLPTEEQWILAAGGEENIPYGYGYHRYEPGVTCHIETKEKKICGDKICDLRKPVDSFPTCKTPYGMISMIGSLDEFVEVPRYAHTDIKGLYMRSALKGCHYSHGRCRVGPKGIAHSVTLNHSEGFFQTTIGVRCVSQVIKSK